VIEILIASANRGKIAEIRSALEGLPCRLLTVDDFPGFRAAAEDGPTYEANALKKARAAAAFSGLVALADDSGLEVEALGGGPGVRSARFAGEDADDRRNNEKLLATLRGVPPERRGARFVCVLAISAPGPSNQKREWLFRGQCEGRIAQEPRGARGFGYDPLFFYPPLRRTFGEIEPAEKLRVSHRGKALQRWKAAFFETLDPTRSYS
jgi:XTP/dITP diphosphohydrolase